ncbi:MAG: hypothetical protein WC475_00890 [Candidatus Paceibacterota bacterium]
MVTILLVVTVFTFHINQAKAAFIIPIILAVTSALAAVAASIVLSVVLPAFAILGIQYAVSGAGTGHFTWFGFFTTILTLGVAPLVAYQYCMDGQDSEYFINCEQQSTAQTPTASQPSLNDESAIPSCNSVTLTYDISNASAYAIYRLEAGAAESSPIDSGDADGLSQITYTDTNLTPQTTYNYILTLFDSGGTQYQYPALSTYTDCLPECTFSSDKAQVVFPETATLSWNCSYADSCSISPTVGPVNAQSGSVVVSPTSTVDYILTCQNSDGSISFSSSLTVVNPTIEEVKP